MTVVIGVDTSLTTSGCARVDLGVGADGQVEALRWETWRGRGVKPDVESVATNRRRIRHMLRQILDRVPDFVDLSVVEGPAMGAKFTPLADERSGLRWMLVDQLLARGPVAFITPGAREVLAVGHGFPRGTTQAARKKAVVAAVSAAAPGALVPDHNVADSVALALAGAHRLGMPWPAPMTAKQEKAYASVAWPEIEGIRA